MANNNNSSTPAAAAANKKKRIRSTHDHPPNNDIPRTPAKICNGSVPCSPRKRLHFSPKPTWNPTDPDQIKAVKELLHVSTNTSTVVCREHEQKVILDFCNSCIRTHTPASLYVCGCPGTGKTLSIHSAINHLLLEEGFGFPPPEILTVNCTTLSTSSAIFTKILENHNLPKANRNVSSLHHLHDLYSKHNKRPLRGMTLLIVDEMDYLITKDKQVLHDLFMLTTFPFSTLILIGIANAIDLADRFLPRLQSLNCKPRVVTFRAYSKDQILRILQQRLMTLGYSVFQPLALEFCARKVAAASGDMRRALGACMSAIEVLEMELKDHSKTHEINMVNFDHMDIALSRAFKSPVIRTIQSLPQHQQMILCSLVNLSRKKKGCITIGELHKSYSEISRSTQVPTSGVLEFSNLCQVLGDQGLVKVTQSRQDKMKRVSLTVDSADIVFALKDVRFFRTCLD